MLKFSITGTAFVGLALLASGFCSPPAHAADLTPDCEARLVLELTPDVPDPHDPGFLSSLLNNHPGYRLAWVREDDDTTIVVDLIGPGPNDECRSVIETMRKDGRIETIRSESDELQSISIHSATPAEDVEPGVHLSRAGLGSLVWAARHPASAYQILLPVQPDDATGARRDLLAACDVAQPRPCDN